MSLLIQGLPTQLVTFAAIPRTLLSGSLVSRLPTLRASAYLFTSTTGTWGPFLFPLRSASACVLRLMGFFLVTIATFDLGSTLVSPFIVYTGRLLTSSGFNSQAPFAPVTPAPTPAVDRSYDLTYGIPGRPLALRASRTLPAPDAQHSVDIINPLYKPDASETEIETETEPDTRRDTTVPHRIIPPLSLQYRGRPTPPVVATSSTSFIPIRIVVPNPPLDPLSAASSSTPRFNPSPTYVDPSDALSTLLFSPSAEMNLFTAGSTSLSALLKLHHTSSPDALARRLHMAFTSLGLLISASEVALPDTFVNVIATSLGLSSDESASRVNSYWALCPPAVLRSFLRTLIVFHLSLCSTKSKICPAFAGDRPNDNSENSSTALQIHILTQPLRRLLELHDVPYVESDNVKRLHSRLKGFLTRLKNGKQPVDGRRSENGKTQRSRKNERLRAEWPQLVPDHLKRRLLDNFGLRISSSKLSTFTCGSYAVAYPATEKKLLTMSDFQFNLLRRPDRIREPDADESGYGSDSCSTTACESDAEDVFPTDVHTALAEPIVVVHQSQQPNIRGWKGVQGTGVVNSGQRRCHSPIFLKDAGRNIFDPVLFNLQCHVLNSILAFDQAEAKFCREAFYVLDKWTTNVP
ncbi:hypothetical protein DFH09DRAFT_1081768 [Mycena vulgaris]|nr:hypothetical protein DFH09DRAFT_1081768 [Mycena vulgaris]